MKGDTGTLNQEIGSLVGGFMRKLRGLYQQFNCDPLWQNQNVYDAIFREVIYRDKNQTEQSLSDFLKSTINNELEKRRQKIYCSRDLNTSNQSLFLGLQNSLSGKSTSKNNIFNSEQSGLSLSDAHKFPFLQSSIPSMNQSISNEQDNFEPQKAMNTLKFNPQFVLSSFNNSFCSMSSQKSYKTYSTERKRQIISYAEKNGIRAASEAYEILPTRISLWIKQMGEEKMARGRKPVDPDMEEKVYMWLKGQLDKGNYMTQKVIRQKAKDISKSVEFKASKGWLEKFFRRRPELFEKYSKNRRNFEKAWRERGSQIQEEKIKTVEKEEDNQQIILDKCESQGEIR